MSYRICCIQLYIIPIPFDRALSFGKKSIETLDRLRVRMTLERASGGQRSTGWGEVPLNYPWFWPDMNSDDPDSLLLPVMEQLQGHWLQERDVEHPLLTGSRFNNLSAAVISHRLGVPKLAVQVINSAFDMALYDAFGNLLNRPVYSLFSEDLLKIPLREFFSDVPEVAALTDGITLPSLFRKPTGRLAVRHMVGIVDALDTGEDEMGLKDWIRRDGIDRLKVKLSGDPDSDRDRLLMIDSLASPLGVTTYSLDYNGPHESLLWLSDFLDEMSADYREVYNKIIYIEQPLKAGMSGYKDDITRVAARKPLLVDEGASSWHTLYEHYCKGWSGAALKICKTQSSALLMFALTRVMGKISAVMDLTNPSLAHISHVQLARYMSDAGELESNACQYCPGASIEEAAVHPGLFQRNKGFLYTDSIQGSGYGFREQEMARILPQPLSFNNRSSNL